MEEVRGSKGLPLGKAPYSFAFIFRPSLWREIRAKD